MKWAWLAFIAGVAIPAGAVTPSPPVSVGEARSSLTGTWQGQLEYLDYTANKWFGIPVTVTIELLSDGVTTIRRSTFDDGPKIGMVLITSIELFDRTQSTVTIGGFRKGRTPDLMTYSVTMGGSGAGARYWRMIEIARSTDDDRPAMLRLTTVRNGGSIETLKEVDFLDDNKDEWLKRNRTRLTLVK